MYKKIMIAIGDDEISRNALREAMHIAAAYGAEICIVHAPVGRDSDHGNGSAACQVGADLLEQAKSTAAQGLKIETRLLEAEDEYGLNGIAEAIANAVAEWKPDLLVVGTKGRRGLERLVIGSVAGQLVSTVDVSVLLVRLYPIE